MASETVGTIYLEAEASSDDDERLKLGKWATKSEDNARMLAMVSRARHDAGVVVTPAELDTDLLAFNLLNGTLDLRSGRLRPHNPAELHTRRARVSFDPKAKCPRWLAFLDRVLDSDGERIRFVQIAFGYTLTGVTSEQSLFFCYGKGQNGKTVLLKVLQALLGKGTAQYLDGCEYGRTASFSAFLERRAGSIPNDIAALVGARLAVASEPNEGQRFDESTLKQLTGTDTVSARFMRAEFFQFEPQFKLWLMANHKPAVRGTDEGIWRRIKLIPFTVHIPERERDKQLEAKLLDELPGILNWALEGCLAWQSDGLPEPAAVRLATEEYRRESDILGAFLEARCEIGSGFSVGATELYTAYKEWALSGGEHVVSQTLFGRQLGERSLEKKRQGSGVYYFGLRVLAMHSREGSDLIRNNERDIGGNRENGFRTLHNPAEVDADERAAIRAEGEVLL